MLLVELDTAPTAPPGLVQVVRVERQPSMWGRAVAVGPDVREVRAAQRVLVSRLQGIEIDAWVLVPEGAVLATEDEA